MMRRQAPHFIRRAAHLAAWPWRRTVQTLGRWRRGQIYGLRRPGWWPDPLGGWMGPTSPHRDKSIVVFLGLNRYEFAPARRGRYRGHVHHGTIRPDAADLSARLNRLNLDSGAARALAIISGFEGGFDAIQTYDRGKFSWGFIQFAATGGLPRLVQDLKARAPALFEECFAAAGIDVQSGQLTIRVKGRTVRGRGAQDRLHDDPLLWTAFLRASWLPQVQDIQVMNAYQNYYAHPLRGVVSLRAGDVRLGDLFAQSEYGRALVCDRAVNRGVGHTILLFRRAARRSRARVIDDAPAILECVRAMEADAAPRLSALERAMRLPRSD